MSELIDRLVEAYNRGDAAAFAACFAVEAQAFEYPGTLAQNGRAEIEAFYRRRFVELPQLRTRVLHRIDLGDRVVDHERVDRGDGAAFECVAIYQIERGEIARIEIVREQRD